MKSFRDLRVWNAAMDLVDEVYDVTGGFPRTEDYVLTSQMRRAAVSVSSNISEGHTREHLREYLHHISVAQGSLAELETQLEISRRRAYVTEEQCRPLLQSIRSVGRQLYALRNSLEVKTSAARAGPRHPTPVT